MRTVKTFLMWLLVVPSLVAQVSIKNFKYYESKLEANLKNSDTLIFYATKLLNEAQNTNAKLETGIAFRYLAEANFIVGDDSLAINYANKAIWSFKNLKNVSEYKADCYRVIGRIDVLKEKYDSAYEALIKAKLLYREVKKLKHPDNEFLVLNNIAYLYILTEKYDMALKILNANLKEPLSDVVLANVYSLFSILANEQGDSRESIKYFKLTKVIYEKLDEPSAALICDMNVAINHYFLKEYEKARIGLEQVLEKSENIKLPPAAIIRTNMYLSLCYFEQKKNEKADRYFKIAESHIAKGGINYISIKHIWIETKVRFLIHKRQFLQAEKLLKEHLSKEKNSSLIVKIDLYKQLKLIAELTGKNDEAKVYNDTIAEFELENELKNKSNVIDLMRAEFKFNAIERELELKKKEFELLQLEEKKSKQILIACIVFGVFLLLFVYILYSRNKKMNAMRESILVKEKLYLESINNKKALEIDFKNKEIVDFALHISEKNEILNEIKSRIKEISPNNRGLKNEVNDILLFINNTINQNSEKIKVYSDAEDVKDSFFQKLKVLYPNLTEKETRVASLVRMQLSSKQIGQQLSITSASVDNYRSLLRKKMQIPKEKSLQEFLTDLV